MNSLKVGDIAPLFVGTTQNEEKISLSDFLGKKVVLYFYPKDNTPGCTAEACSLRDGYSELKKMGFEVLGVSPDAVTTHKKFIAKHQLPFTIFADTENEISTAYDVWKEKSLFGHKYMGIVRTTFIIDEKGVIEKIFEKIKTKGHFEQIVDSYK
ncbi:MAG: thioredoxin-dependent thiol peroxidase [Bacteroidetes bacterium]|nr:thioredoxin-dependent thiol peroxidase [Bacteroidota bacterium]